MQIWILFPCDLRGKQITYLNIKTTPIGKIKPLDSVFDDEYFNILDEILQTNQINTLYMNKGSTFRPQSFIGLLSILVVLKLSLCPKYFGSLMFLKLWPVTKKSKPKLKYLFVFVVILVISGGQIFYLYRFHIFLHSNWFEI